MLVEERMKHDPVTVKRDLRQSAPSPATTLEVHELNYLLERLTIEAIMTKKVVTVAPETSLLDAAKLLLKHKIGCLPVVDNEELVGIITEGDMLRALVELLEKAADVSPAELMVEDRPGAFEAVGTAAGAGGATVLSGTVVRQGERRPVLLIRAPSGAAADLRRRLTTAGHSPLPG